MLEKEKQSLYIRYRKGNYFVVTLCVTDYSESMSLDGMLTMHDIVTPTYYKAECRANGMVLHSVLDMDELIKEGIHDLISFISDFPAGVESDVFDLDFSESRLRKLRVTYPSLIVSEEYHTPKGDDGWVDDGWTLEDVIAEDLQRFDFMWWKGVGYEHLKDREKAVREINQDGIAVSYLKWKEVQHGGVDSSFLSDKEYNKITRFSQDIRGYYNTLFESGF